MVNPAAAGLVELSGNERIVVGVGGLVGIDAAVEDSDIDVGAEVEAEEASTEIALILLYIRIEDEEW